MPNFALYCDWIIWDLDNIFVDYSKNPRIIFVRSDINCLNFFTRKVLGRLDNDCALVTASHDLTMPLGFHRKFELDWQTIVNNEHVKYWFTENRDLIHPKIRAIPLGLPHPDLPSWIKGVGTTGSVWYSDDIVKNPLKVTRTNKVFSCWYDRMGHSSGTCTQDDNERSQAYEHISVWPDIFDWHPPSLTRRDFIKKLGEYEFVLCPHGGGLDPNPKCWESLIMKAIPIVKKNSITEALEHLPIVIVENWEDITRPRLTTWKREHEHRLYADNIGYLMSNSYFIDQINGMLDK